MDAPNMTMEYAMALEDFGMAAIKKFYDMGVELNLFTGAELPIILDAMNYEAEEKMREQVQEHFDEHAKTNEPCPDYEAFEKLFELARDDKGRVIVGKRIAATDKQGLN